MRRNIEALIVLNVDCQKYQLTQSCDFYKLNLILVKCSSKEKF